MLSCVPYVCMRSRDVLNSSIYLILSSSMDLGASGRLSRAFKQCQNFPSDPLVRGPASQGPEMKEQPNLQQLGCFGPHMFLRMASGTCHAKK